MIVFCIFISHNSSVTSSPLHLCEIVFHLPHCDVVFCHVSDDLQDVLEHNADERGEAAVHGFLEKAQPGLSPETRAEEEDL